jgi:hypothetical protein
MIRRTVDESRIRRSPLIRHRLPGAFERPGSAGAAGPQDNPARSQTLETPRNLMKGSASKSFQGLSKGFPRASKDFKKFPKISKNFRRPPGAGDA